MDHMLDACSQVECVSTTTGASTDDEPEFLMKSPRVTTIARKQLATAVRDLMQHGLIQASAFGRPCASSKSSLLNRHESEGLRREMYRSRNNLIAA